MTYPADARVFFHDLLLPPASLESKAGKSKRKERDNLREKRHTDRRRPHGPVWQMRGLSGRRQNGLGHSYVSRITKLRQKLFHNINLRKLTRKTDQIRPPKIHKTITKALKSPATLFRLWRIRRRNKQTSLSHGPIQ